MSRADEIGNAPAYANEFYSGMTIRQVYKIAAMQGLLTSVSVLGMKGFGGKHLEENLTLANVAGHIADAMLAEDSAHEAAMSGKGE